MKKHLLLLASSVLLLAGCGQTNSNDTPTSSESSSEVVSPTCEISTSLGGTLEAFYSGKSLGVATSSSSLSLKDLSIGETITIKANIDEGYKTASATLNGATIKGNNSYYSIKIEKESNTVSFSFKLIETDVNDFGYTLDEDKKEATIVSYSPEEMPTPVILPTAYTKNGTSYSVTGIAANAFDNCEATKITISSSIKSIEYAAFQNAYNMHYFNVDGSSSTYSAKDGVLMNKAGTEIIAFPARYEKDSYTMPDGIASIAPYAFYCNRVLKNITFSSTLSSIGEYCFYNANAMKVLSFPSSLKKIETYAFYQNSELTTINFSEGLEEIGSSAFYGLVKLQSLSFPKSLRKICDNAFFKCDRLSSITFAEGIEEIDTLAFSNLTNFTKLVLPASLKRIGNSAFSACSALETVTFSEGLEEIGNYAFALCSSIRSLKLPASLKKVGFNPFYAVLELDEDTFSISSANENYTISEGVLYTKDMSKLVSYPYGKKATSYVIPSTVTEISNQAFRLNATLLEVRMPLSVTRIDEGFYSVSSALHIIYEGTEADFNKIDTTGSNSYDWNGSSYSLYVTYSDSAE